MRLPAVDPARALRILERILRQPTAPFHEHAVRTAIARALAGAGIATRIDRFGNLVARYRQGRAKPAAFSAHMDHPGLEIAKVRGTLAEARWHGQIPPFNLRGLAIRLGGGRTATILRGDARGTPPEKRLSLRVPRGTPEGEFGYADLTPFRTARGRIVSKALDDVAGCGAIAACLDHLARRRIPGDVLAVFTRAEEVGFHGAFGALRAGTLPQYRPIVVLECSKTLPGVIQGGGPVIRVGDRMTVFDPDLAASMVEVARKEGLRFQRKLMDGGACEATAFGLAARRVAGVAFPLGNYHNLGARGVAPEFISRRDYLDGVSLLAAFAARGLDPAGARRRLQAAMRGRFGPQEARRLRASARAR